MSGIPSKAVIEGPDLEGRGSLLSPQCSQKIEGDSTLESSPMPGADIDIQNNMHSPLSMRSTKRQPKLWLFSFSNTERRIAIQDETPEVESHI